MLVDKILMIFKKNLNLPVSHMLAIVNTVKCVF